MYERALKTRTADQIIKEQDIRRKVILSFQWKKLCLICERSRDKIGCKQLCVIETYERAQSMYEAAKERNDSTMLHNIQGDGDNVADLIARDGQYHKSCMDVYRANRNVASKRKSVQEEPVSTNVHEELFNKVPT